MIKGAPIPRTAKRQHGGRNVELHPALSEVLLVCVGGVGPGSSTTAICTVVAVARLVVFV